VQNRHCNDDFLYHSLSLFLPKSTNINYLLIYFLQKKRYHSVKEEFMARCVVVSAAEIKNYEKVKSYFKSDDFFVFCDGGLNHIKKLGVKPNLIIGDFDSACKNDFDISQIETIELPCQKDDTDTFFAVKEALNRGFDDFLCVGCIGNRFDHSLCNVSVLLYLQEKNVNSLLLDDYSEMQIVAKEKIFIDDSFSYFSLMCVAGDAEGVNILDAEYPLKNAKIKSSYNYGISNKINRGKRSCVWVEKGCMLLLKIF